MSLRYFAALLLITSAPLLSQASVNSFSSSQPASLERRESQLSATAKRSAKFASVVHTASHDACQLAQPPQALATPDPLLDRNTAAADVTVSFIIGTDGRVHSPLILESAVTSEDRVVLDAVRTWRFRPAMCNGAPTETEAKIGFSTR